MSPAPPPPRLSPSYFSNDSMHGEKGETDMWNKGGARRDTHRGEVERDRERKAGDGKGTQMGRQ